MAGPVIVGITGASGAVMARALVDELLRRDLPTAVVCSNAARMVWQEEMGSSINETLVEWQEHPAFVHYALNDLRAPIASGSYPAAGMAIAPASMNSIASLAAGISGNLLLRGRRRLPQGTPPPRAGAAGNTAAQYTLGKYAHPEPNGGRHTAPGPGLLPETRHD